jgi:hypothetical protein
VGGRGTGKKPENVAEMNKYENDADTKNPHTQKLGMAVSLVYA